jgi:hypothetical protein
MEESKFKKSMREWIEKNGNPKVIYVHPDDLPDPLPDEWPAFVKMEVSRYVERGSVIFSSMDPNLSILEGIAPDYETPKVNIRMSPFATEYVNLMDRYKKDFNSAFGLTREQLGLPINETNTM